MYGHVARPLHEQVRWICQKATVGSAGPPLAPGKGGYADWVIIALHGIKEHLGHSYRQLMDVLSERPRIRRQLGLSHDELPHFTTVCHANERLCMPNWRAFLDLTSNLQELGEVQAIDASGFDRIAASRKYANRTDYTFTYGKSCYRNQSIESALFFPSAIITLSVSLESTDFDTMASIMGGKRETRDWR